MQDIGPGKSQADARPGIPAALMHLPDHESVVEAATPSNSRERPRPPVSESADSRATSLGVQNTSHTVMETEALDKLLFGAIYSLTWGSRQGTGSEAMHEMSQLVSMASQLRVANPQTALGAQKELQERCQRLVARLPTAPSDPCSTGSDEAPSQGTGPSEPSTLAGQRPGSEGTSVSRLSLDSRLSTRVLLPRQQPQQQQQRSIASSSRPSSRRPTPAVNPFDLARSEDGMSVEAIEEDEMEFMVEEVTTPGGTVREVVIHESSSEAPALKPRARSEEMPDVAAAAGGDAAADEAPGAVAQQLEFRVASVNDGSEADAAMNPFADARATDAVSAATSIMHPLPVKRRQGSLGMAREDLLSRVGDASDLASAAAQDTEFLDPLASADGSSLASGSEPGSGGARGLEAGGSAQERVDSSVVPAAMQAAAAQSAGAAGLQDEAGVRRSRDSRRSSGEVASVPMEKRHKTAGEPSKKPSRTGSGQSNKSAPGTSEVAEKIRKRSNEKNQQRDSGKERGKHHDAATKLKSRSSWSGKQLSKGNAAPAPITRLRIRNDHPEFNPFSNQKGWRIDFCCCPMSAHMPLGGIDSTTYPTFHEAAEELSRQATIRAAEQARGGGMRNDPLGPSDSGASAIDDEFLSGAANMYSEFVPRRAQQAVLTPAATALPAVRSSAVAPGASLGAATSSTASQTLRAEQSSSAVLSEGNSDKARGCGCWPFGR